MNFNPITAAPGGAKTNQIKAGLNGQSARDLTVGQLVRATVLEVLADSDAVLLDIAGQVMRAKNQSSGELVPGKAIYVRIAESTPELITVKIEDEQAVVAEQSLEKALAQQLQRLGLDARPILKSALRALHQQQVPITPQNVITLRDDVTSFRQLAAQLGRAAEAATQAGQSDDQIVDWTKLSKVLIVAAKTALNQPAAGEANRQTAVQSSPDAVEAGLRESSKAPAEAANKQLTPSSAESLKAAPATETIKPAVVDALTKGASATANIKTEAVDEMVKSPISANTADRSAAAQGERQSVPLHHLNDVLTKNLLALDARDSGHLMRLFATMQKLNVPRTPLNTVLFDQLMQGKTDALAAVLDAIEPDRMAVSDKLATLLERFGESIIEYRDISEEGLDGKALKELADLNISLNKILIEASVRSETGQRAELVEVAKQNLNLLTDQINWQAIHIPMRLKDEIRDVEVYVRGDAQKSGRFNPDNGLVYIALNTENLATVKVKLYFKGDQLSIVFLAESDAYRDHLKAFDNVLVDAVGALVDKPVSVSYGLADQASNLSEMIKVADIQLSSFDQRV